MMVKLTSDKTKGPREWKAGARDMEIAMRWHAAEESQPEYAQAVKVHSYHEGKLGFQQKTVLDMAIQQKIRRAPIAALLPDEKLSASLQPLQPRGVELRIEWSGKGPVHKNALDELCHEVVASGNERLVQAMRLSQYNEPKLERSGIALRAATMEELRILANQLIAFPQSPQHPVAPKDYEIQQSDVGTAPAISYR